MTNAEDMNAYSEWLRTLSSDELENERYTMEREWRIIGMRARDAEDRAWACKSETERRAAERLS